MKMKKIISIAIMLLALVSARADLYTENFNNLNTAIPDANPAGILLSGNVADVPAGWVISSVAVTLNVTNGYNGDLYAYLVAPDGTLVTIMNQPGVGVDGFGASGSGMNITLQDGTTDHGPIQNETGYLNLTGSYNPAMALTNFNNKIAHGAWKLFVADLSDGGGTSVVKGWSMSITADRQIANVALNRHTGTGSSSTYGDSLSFDVSVSGTTPSGTVTLKDGGTGGLTLGIGTLSGGVCTITPALNLLIANSHTNIVAVYGGDSVFAPANSIVLSAQTVAQKSLVIIGVTAGDKIYDATTGVAINTASAALSGLVGDDSGNVALSSTGASASFGDKTTAAGKTVTTVGFTISGSASANYLLVQPGLTASISTKSLNVAGNLSVPASKVYGGNTGATVSGSSGLQTAETVGTGSTADGKPYSGDVVSLSGAVTQANYDSKDVNATLVTFLTGSLALAGGDHGNYSFSSLIQQAASITPLPVVLTGTRNYDGTTNAAAAILSVANKVGSDLVLVASGTGGLEGKDVGAQSLTSTGSLTLGSNPASDYTLTGASGSVLITPADVSVTANNTNKVYGTANPVFTATVLGALNSDMINYTLVTTASQFSGVGVSNITVSLGSNPNYTVATTNGLLTITSASTSIVAGSSANPSGFNDSIYFTASLPSDAAGSVVFKTNGVAFDTASLSSGTATSVATTALARGNTTITAEYAGSINYVGNTNSFTQTVTNHLPVAGLMLVTRTAGLSLKIALPDLATNWSDVDGDAVTLASLNLTTTNGVSLVQSNGWIYYTNAPNVADQISYSLNDGHGGTNTGYVNIAVSFALVTGQTTGITVPDGNAAVVSFAGIPGYTYQVQRSTNLTDWVTISTTNAPAGGLFNYTDTFGDLGGNAPTSAYYRLGWTPSP